MKCLIQTHIHFFKHIPVFCRAIQSISNHLIYNGALECGNDDIATATLHLPQWDDVENVRNMRKLTTWFSGKRDRCDYGLSFLPTSTQFLFSLPFIPDIFNFHCHLISDLASMDAACVGPSCGRRSPLPGY